MNVKGVIVAAGYGTRFLPVTKVVPKELLPLVDRPAIDYVVQEFIDAGITDILVITSRRKKALEDWFDHDAELEAVFRREGADAKLAKAQPVKANVQFVRQREMKGTGHALMLARTFIGNDPFVVAYPDDLFPQGCAADLIEVHKRTGGCVLAAVDLSGEDVSRYGVLDADDQLKVHGMVEKPAPGTEPSHLISLGRYLYTPELFAALDHAHSTHEAGEFYATDAIQILAAQGKVHAHVVDGPRWDTGAPLGYLKAVVSAALHREDVGPEFKAWLGEQLD
jgi:UTP--glucose-1-phosphate uridylyltransferase